MPSSVPLPPSRRVVVRFRRDLHLPYDASAVNQLNSQAGHDWKEIDDPYPGARFGLLYPSIAPDLLNSYSLLTPSVGTEPFHFTNDFVIDCPPNVSPAAVAERIGAWQSVGMAYVQAGAAPPPSSVLSANNLLSSYQHYLSAAPDGINAHWVWNNTPANGTGVRLVDLEQGWFFDHEDLLDAMIPAPIWGENLVFRDHGTSVLGVVRATDNHLGVVGIAPQCQMQVVSPWTCNYSPCVDHSGAGLEYHTHNVAEAIHAAIPALNPGDVLLIESQTGTPDGYGGALPPWLPVEVDVTVFNAIRAAVTKGIIVIEAAANGGQDLDAYTQGGLQILNPTAGSGAFRDSGAIVVAAAITVSPPTQIHERLSDTNFGTRVDCFAWGQGVRTAGEVTGTLNVRYPMNFGQTSAASAIVAGAAVLLQSWRDAIGEPRYSPARLRELFRDQTLNTPSKNLTTDRIGVMPNLQMIIETERASTREFCNLPLRHHGDAARLFSGRDGVSPLRSLREWLAALDPTERDLAIALAVTELAAQANRKSAAKRLAKAARRILKHARKKAKRKR